MSGSKGNIVSRTFLLALGGATFWYNFWFHLSYSGEKRTLSVAFHHVVDVKGAPDASLIGLAKVGIVKREGLFIANTAGENFPDETSTTSPFVGVGTPEASKSSNEKMQMADKETGHSKRIRIRKQQQKPVTQKFIRIADSSPNTTRLKEESDKHNGTATDNIFGVQNKKTTTQTNATTSSNRQPHRRSTKSIISKIFLLGERNSGTNYVEHVLKEALSPRYSTGHTKYPFSKNLPVLFFKHMFRDQILNSTELEVLQMHKNALWIFVVRSPCDWAEAMYRRPWHMCHPQYASKCQGPYIGIDHRSLWGVSLAKFFEIPWSENVETVDGSLRNFSYPSVFALRRHKLSIMKQITEIAQHRVKIVHLKEIEVAPARFVDNLVREFNLQLQRNYRPPEPTTKPHYALCLNTFEWANAQRQIDWEMERHFGFHPLDCHTCPRQ